MNKKALYGAVLLLLALVGGFHQEAFAAQCQTEDPYPYTAPYQMETCPHDIQAWMDRAGGCAHFSGEEAYDEDRGAFLKEQMDQLQCAQLGCDFDALFGKYEGDVSYIGVLTDYAALTYGDTENLPACQGQKE